MKIDITKVLLIVIIVFMVWSNFFKKADPIEIPPVTVTIPETSGTSGVQVVTEYEPYPVRVVEKETLYVDLEWKKRYEEATDSLAKYEQYLQAIKINRYEETLVDNDTIKISGIFAIRGALLNYSVDYTINPVEITYTPEVISQNPRLSLGIGAEVGIPTRIGQEFTLKGNFNLMNRRGREINLGYDTNATAWLGYTHNFKIIK